MHWPSIFRGQFQEHAKQAAAHDMPGPKSWARKKFNRPAGCEPAWYSIKLLESATAPGGGGGAQGKFAQRQARGGWQTLRATPDGASTWLRCRSCSALLPSELMCSSTRLCSTPCTQRSQLTLLLSAAKPRSRTLPQHGTTSIRTLLGTAQL